MAALRGLVALSHVSGGAAREVLRQVAAGIGTDAGQCAGVGSVGGGQGGRYAGGHKHAAVAEGGADKWMVWDVRGVLLPPPTSGALGAKVSAAARGGSWWGVTPR